jgi:peptidyl-prolyl cis-trans isomerase SurA
LWNAQDDEMLPATLSTAGVELWAVCGRKVIPAQEKERASAQNELQQKEFELMAKRHLKDLRQDAHIEYR